MIVFMDGCTASLASPAPRPLSVSGKLEVERVMAEAKRRELCEELDRSLLEVMESLKQLSSLRNKYREDVKEVGIK